MKKSLMIFCLGFFILVKICSTGSCESKVKNTEPIDVNYRSLISRADLNYIKPVTLSQAGMPVGTGRMGSLVWTSPASLKFQINRVDVYAVGNSTNSFPIRNTDYANGCGYVDINLSGYGEDVFTSSEFNQHLSVYDGVMEIKGKNVSARVYASHEKDIIAIDIDDKRKLSESVNIDLRMLRYRKQYNGMVDNNPLSNLEQQKKHTIKVITAEHTATSRLDVKENVILLSQEFREKDYYNASSVAITVEGRKTKARYLNESTVQLSVAPGKNRYTVLISSASSFTPEKDVETTALNILKSAKKEGSERLLYASKEWWHKYWSKSYVHLQSDDGKADYLEKRYTFFLYVMGSSSLGDYPPRFINWIFSTDGDNGIWGSLTWWWNQSAAYNGIPSTNHFELMDPLYNKFTRHFNSYATAARQTWGSKGIWFPETTWFNGLEELPEDIAGEMQELYLLRKPWNEKSERFIRYASSKMPYDSRWNWIDRGHWDQGRWIAPEKPLSPFTQLTHQYSATAKIAYLYWQRYAFTMDKDFLREQAYPILKGAVEFYRNFPYVKKDKNGKYNIYLSQYEETELNIQNSTEDMMSMYGIIPLVIRASEILDIDAEMRPVWKEFYENLAPIVTHNDLSINNQNPGYWSVGFKNKPIKRACLDPAIYFDIMTIGTEDLEIIKKANATYDNIYHDGVKENIGIAGSDLNPIAAAHLGRGEDLKHMLTGQVPVGTPEDYFNDSIKYGILPNYFVLQTGGAIDCENTGNFVTALQTGLIQSVPPSPGKESVIYVFPAWPKDWDAAYKLLARGGFIVSTSFINGKIRFIEVESQVGGPCKIKNPWMDKSLTIVKNGNKTGEISGKLLEFETEPEDIILLFPVGMASPFEEKVPFKNQ